MDSTHTQADPTPFFQDWPERTRLNALSNWLPSWWRTSQRQAVIALGETLELIRDRRRYRLIGCSTWAEYTDEHLLGPAEAFNRVIDAARALKELPIYAWHETAGAAVEEVSDAERQAQVRLMRDQLPARWCNTYRGDLETLARMLQEGRTRASLARDLDVPPAALEALIKAAQLTRAASERLIEAACA